MCIRDRYQGDLPSGADERHIVVRTLEQEMIDLSFLEKWWRIATAMLKPYMIQFTFMHEEAPVQIPTVTSGPSEPAAPTPILHA